MGPMESEFGDKIESFGGSKGDQFKAHLGLEESPFNMAVGHDAGTQTMALIQNGGESYILFCHPDDMRAAAAMMIEQAGAWERGEVNGMGVPK
jgi:hypothetical protein